MADDTRDIDTLTYFSMQMCVHIVRILAANGLEDRLKSAIRQTLAQGIEQFSPQFRGDLEGLAQTLFSAVDGGVADKSKPQE